MMELHDMYLGQLVVCTSTFSMCPDFLVLHEYLALKDDPVKGVI